MYKLTLTTLLNTTKDSSGLPKWHMDKDNNFVVKRVGKFSKEEIVSIHKTYPENPELSTATLKLEGEALQPGFYRISAFVRLSGEQRTDYANAYVLPGQPIVIEYFVKTGDTVTTITNKIVETLNNLQSEYGNTYADIDVSESKGSILLSARREYQIFDSAKVEKINEEDQWFDPIIVAYQKGDKRNDGKNILTPNKEGVGTYETLIRTIRMPNQAATGYLSLNKEEQPLPNHRYVQYVIWKEKSRDVMGTDAMGDMVRSAVCNVFFVEEHIADKFEASLKGVGVEIKEVNKSDAVVTPPTGGDTETGEDAGKGKSAPVTKEK